MRNPDTEFWCPWLLSFGGWCKTPNHQPIGGSDPNHQGICALRIMAQRETNSFPAPGVLTSPQELERMGVELVQSNNAAFQGKTVFIVRHAQGQHNVSPRFEFDPPLTPYGIKQVAAPCY